MRQWMGFKEKGIVAGFRRHGNKRTYNFYNRRGCLEYLSDCYGLEMDSCEKNCLAFGMCPFEFWSRDRLY
jgi:hypothetical protein